MTGLGPEATAFLEAAREGDEPARVDMDRVRAAIATRIATSTAVGLTAAIATRSSASAAGIPGAGGASAVPALLAGWASKALTAVALVGVMGMGAAMVVRAPPRAFAPSTSIGGRAHAYDRPNRTVAPPMMPSPASEELAPLPQASVQALPVPSALSRRTGPVTGDVAAEVRLLGEAQTAMRSRDAERALRVLDEYARRYPGGTLGEERDAMRIAALCALGRDVEARRATDRFLRAAPQSPHAGPLRASCGGSMSTSESPL
jgi:hypothetical protein